MKRRFQEQLGSYVIDLKETKLGIYERDSSLYKNLSIKFNADSTFVCNMSVPFMLDSVGIWKTGGAGVDDWNYLYYKERGYGTNRGDQFDQCSGRDSSFLINSVTPQIGKNPVSKIVFKKLLSKP